MIHIGLFILGMFTGALGMVYHYEPHSKPVVTVEQDGADRKDMGQSTNSSASSQQARDAAPPLAVEQQLEQYKRDTTAAFARQEQRNKELAFALRKLQGVKQTWDVALGEVGR